MSTRQMVIPAILVAGCVAPVHTHAAPVITSESPASAASGAATASRDESVVTGTIAWSDRRGVELTLGNGTHLVVPLSVRGVLHTDLKPRRPIKAYCAQEGGEKVVTLMFIEGVHPGGGG